MLEFGINDCVQVIIKTQSQTKAHQHIAIFVIIDRQFQSADFSTEKFIHLEAKFKRYGRRPTLWRMSHRMSMCHYDVCHSVCRRMAHGNTLLHVELDMQKFWTSYENADIRWNEFSCAETSLQFCAFSKLSAYIQKYVDTLDLNQIRDRYVLQKF